MYLFYARVTIFILSHATTDGPMIFFGILNSFASLHLRRQLPWPCLGLQQLLVPDCPSRLPQITLGACPRITPSPVPDCRSRLPQIAQVACPRVSPQSAATVCSSRLSQIAPVACPRLQQQPAPDCLSRLPPVCHSRLLQIAPTPCPRLPQSHPPDAPNHLQHMILVAFDLSSYHSATILI